jgi:hypothetical protein
VQQTLEVSTATEAYVKPGNITLVQRLRDSTILPIVIAKAAPDPAMPWLALRNSTRWELQLPIDTSPGVSEATTKTS